MTKERLQQALDNIIDWACEHDRDFVQCLIDAAGFTKEEIVELDLTSWIEEE